MYLLCMVVAMWKEGNVTSIRCIGVLGGGHVMELEQDSVGKERILDMVVAMQYKERICVVVMYLYWLNMYMYI